MGSAQFQAVDWKPNRANVIVHLLISKELFDPCPAVKSIIHPILVLVTYIIPLSA